MSIRKQWLVLGAVTWVVAGCAAASPAGSGMGAPTSLGVPAVAAPTATAVPPLIVGAGLPTDPAGQWLEGAAGAASAVSAPVHGVACAASALLWGFFYALYFPGDFSEDFKRLIERDCAGPYVVTPAGVGAAVPVFPARAIRTPRMGRLPVEEVVRISAPR